MLVAEGCSFTCWWHWYYAEFKYRQDNYLGMQC